MKQPNAGTEAVTPLADALAEFDALSGHWQGRRPILFLDYDGTLAPIAPKPELATLDQPIRELLAQASAFYSIAIVSGRDRRDVKRLIALDNVIYAGSHGFDISGPEGLALEHEEGGRFLDALDVAELQLRNELARIDGVLVERKRYAIAVHYRLVALGDIPAVALAVDRAAVASARALRQTGGKKVFELRPRLPWDKGKAVGWLLEELPVHTPNSFVPIYIGDDETDEDAFAAIRERAGVAILVAETPRVTQAQYLLRDPAAVGCFLRRLVVLRQRENRARRGGASG